MLLETYKLSINDLKLTCSTTIYKNLSLTIRIQNRQYTIVPSTGYFDGTSTLKSRFIDTIDFQFDLERNKYLPKQIQLELKLIYRTGKINQKIYAINFNQFSTVRKGVKEKVLKVLERLYSLQCTITAKSNGTDSPFFNQQFSGLERVKSEKKFQKQGSDLNQLNKKRYYKSKSPQPVIKYTINENIKITRTQEPQQNSFLSQNHIRESREKSILKESFQLKDESSSFAQRNRQFTERIKKSIQVHQYPIKAINSAINERNRMQALQTSVNNLGDQLQKQKQSNYKLQKQIANLKNKIQHLYHEKALLVSQKQQIRMVFETKDKQQKIRQRRDIEQLRRHFEGVISQKDKQISKLTIELKQTYNATNESQAKSQQLSIFFNKKMSQLQRIIQNKNEQLVIKNQQISDLMSGQYVNKCHYDQLQNQNKIKQNKMHNLQNQLQYYIQLNNNKNINTNNHINHHVNQIHRSYSSPSIRQQKNRSHQFIQQTTRQQRYTSQEYSLNNFQANNQNQQLIILVDKQTKTYHQMIARLQENIQKLQTQLKIMETNHRETAHQLQQKTSLLNQKNQIINHLKNNIKSLEDKLHSQKNKVIQIKSLLSEFNNSESCLKDKLDKQKRHIKYRSYSLGSLNPSCQTVKIKTTQRYRLVYAPQSALIYVPPIQTTVIQPSSKQVQYGTNYNQYGKTSSSIGFFSENSPYLQYTSGYFGVPLNISQSSPKQQLDNYSKRSAYKGSSIRNNYFDENSFIQKNKDEYVVQNSQDSYINENGDYVKERRKTVYKKN